MIVGPVGSGKSSLLQAILSELGMEQGSINVNGNVSYASQESWLFGGSIRQNILFGETWDFNRYDRVIKACALERDFTILPKGDNTIIGAGGSGLSGGQKARINLARAVYRKAAMYLLDDPLSAMDAHVSRQIFDNCIKDYLKKSVVILATHQLQYLQQADQIIVLGQGKVQAQGTYQNLLRSGIDFVKLLEEQEKIEIKRQTVRQSFIRSSLVEKRGTRLSKYYTKMATIRLTRNTLTMLPEADESTDPLFSNLKNNSEVPAENIEEENDQGTIQFDVRRNI